jgi:hypothetical protein
MMSSIHPWVARSQLKLYLFPEESTYPSKHFTRPEPIEVTREEVWVMEWIENERKKYQHHQFLVHWKGHPEHDTT